MGKPKKVPLPGGSSDASSCAFDMADEEGISSEGQRILSIIGDRIDSAVRMIIERIDKKDEVISKMEESIGELKKENSALRERLENVRHLSA